MTATILTAGDIDLMPLFAPLKPDGASLIATLSGRQCLSQLRNTTPELIIIDEHLPDARGSDIGSRIKQVSRLKHVPLVLPIPERNSERLRTEAALIGADAVLVRPASSERLRATVRQLLARADRIAPIEASVPVQPPVSA
jgi:DNA-binding response OmpR family regulator